MSFSEHFDKLAQWTAAHAGRASTFCLALAVIVVWAVSGPIFGFSDTWQLIINTGTTIVTFLMVFLIQNSQNRDARALQIKLDELIRATRGAHNGLLDLEKLEEAELQRFQQRYEQLARRARECARQDDDDIGSPEIDDEEAGNGRAAR